MAVFRDHSSADRVQTHNRPYNEQASAILEALDFDSTVEITDSKIEDLRRVLDGIQEIIDMGLLSLEDLRASRNPRRTGPTATHEE